MYGLDVLSTHVNRTRGGSFVYKLFIATILNVKCCVPGRYLFSLQDTCVPGNVFKKLLFPKPYRRVPFTMYDIREENWSTLVANNE